MWKDIWVGLQEPEVVLTVLHIPAYKALILPGNQEVDVLAQVRALATDQQIGYMEGTVTTAPGWDSALPRMPDCP